MTRRFDPAEDKAPATVGLGRRDADNRKNSGAADPVRRQAQVLSRASRP